jgi:hypothetical protein
MYGLGLGPPDKDRRLALSARDRAELAKLVRRIIGDTALRYGASVPDVEADPED